ncbi:hypothetical protein VII00023_09074 [Vibrio ichthyoenteri ATCC 700023]|uniref:DUF6868 domain-containing protein n=1 Tax=Vibrio ichthyoenteri ATCC 700023 TaxID=870968 RepID=F9S8R4_9VIBR|nr:hypothetical protein [Vibrio ichthyoenteri]EGU29551.1 hypothetical protein VII00023_09074 [Vibrio ichthyoenteri ATCC 700023]
MDIEVLRAFFGWCSVLNLLVLTVAGFLLFNGQQRIMRIHRQFIALSDDELKAQYFRYLATYKLLILVFNVVPYVALYIIA